MKWEKDGYVLRLAEEGDWPAYYEENYAPLDPEVARLTGCPPAFRREDVETFFHHSLLDEERRMFLLISPRGHILGESVINEIDGELQSANFRICIFHPTDRGKGLGTWMVRCTRDYAFEELKLHRLSLDVYAFNSRAEKAYLAAGFRREGVLRDAVRDGESYGDDILMAMLEDEWRAQKVLESEAPGVAVE